MFLEHKADVIKQDNLDQKCSKNMSWKPQKVLRTLFGMAIGEPGRFATASQFLKSWGPRRVPGEA
eukprot:1329320-Pyramimonas_sp.AAC.1